MRAHRRCLRWAPLGLPCASRVTPRYPLVASYTVARVSLESSLSERAKIAGGQSKSLLTGTIAASSPTGNAGGIAVA